MTIPADVNGSAVVSVDFDVGLYGGFAFCDEAGSAEDGGRAGDVILRCSSNII